MRATSARVVRNAMFGSDQAPAEVLNVRESSGDDDASFYRVRYTGLARPSGISDQHLILVAYGDSFRADCRIGKAQLEHRAEPGNITLIPAGSEWQAVLPGGAQGLIVALPRTRFGTAVARNDGTTDSIDMRLRGQDRPLASIMGELAQTVRFSNEDRSDWHSLVDELADHLSLSYPIRRARPSRGQLSPAVLARLNAYIDDRLDQSLAGDTLADVARQSRSHFPRLFRRTVGMSPHQYVLRVRLRQARSLMARGCPLVEVAAAAGFSDQSHLTNWIRRLYGTTPGRMLAKP